MGHWLVKTEPADYSIADLEREGTTVWDGVRNHLALRHLQAMSPGDEVLIYHTGRQRAIVGVGQAVSPAYPSPTDGQLVVDIQYISYLAQPVTLAFLKSQPSLHRWELVRLPRLSVMPVPDSVFEQILGWGRGGDIDAF